MVAIKYDYHIIRTCTKCHKEQVIEVMLEDHRAWENGKLIQVAFPYLSSDERELLISGTCGSCFVKMFPEE